MRNGGDVSALRDLIVEGPSRRRHALNFDRISSGQVCISFSVNSQGKMYPYCSPAQTWERACPRFRQPRYLGCYGARAGIRSVAASVSEWRLVGVGTQKSPSGGGRTRGWGGARRSGLSPTRWPDKTQARRRRRTSTPPSAMAPAMAAKLLGSGTAEMVRLVRVKKVVETDVLRSAIF